MHTSVSTIITRVPFKSTVQLATAIQIMNDKVPQKRAPCNDNPVWQTNWKVKYMLLPFQWNPKLFGNLLIYFAIKKKLESSRPEMRHNLKFLKAISSQFDSIASRNHLRVAWLYGWKTIPPPHETPLPLLSCRQPTYVYHCVRVGATVWFLCLL